LIGGVLATRGGLVFVGEGDGTFAAFDSASGARLWGHALGAGVNAPPVCYAVNGTHYVAVAAGGSRFFGFPSGDRLSAYALP
jgi:glucose dehydrogenase